MPSEMEKKPVIVSACLLGINNRYDGSNAFNKSLLKRLEGHPLIPVCPETLGGLKTPRLPATIRSNGNSVGTSHARIIDSQGTDVTHFFLSGAKRVIDVARRSGAHDAFLKEKSPSCGVNRIITGDGEAVRGMGTTTTMLKNMGLKVHGVD